MRQLTHYELIILINNQLKCLNNNGFGNNSADVSYVQARAKEILAYTEEYFSLDKEETC